MASGNLSRINTNISALNALNALNKVNSKMSTHQLRLATGKRINSAADDAAGFTIASKLKVKSDGLGTALDNIGSAKNLMTVAEGHLTNIQDILTEMKSKAMQAANDTLGSAERTAILNELQEFNSQINEEINQAQWSGVDILQGTEASKSFQIGTSSTDTLAFDVVANVSGVSTTFNSSGLDIVASTSSVKAVATSGAIATSGGAGMDSATVAFGTSGTLNSLTNELSAGTYTLQVNSTAGGSAAATTITISLLDSDGHLVEIDSDGAAGGLVGTSLTISTTGANPASVDLGVGITVDLATISTGADGALTQQITYTEAGHQVDSQTSAQNYMTKIDAAIDNVTEGLSYIGSQINRLNFQEESVTVAQTNTQSAYSRIVDADMAWEQLEATKQMILQQTATAMLAQANTAPQSVLALFGG